METTLKSLSAKQPQTQTEISKSRKANILIVDDSPLMRKMVVQALSGYRGICFLEAENGVDALAKMQTFNPGLIILDYNMPQMNGIEYLRKIRMQKEYNQTPVVMLTTEKDEAKMVNAYLVGATVFLNKPFFPQALEKIVGTLVHWAE